MKKKWIVVEIVISLDAAEAMITSFDVIAAQIL